jgi:acyl carrier protein
MAQHDWEQDIRRVIARQAGCEPDRIGLHDDVEEILGLDSLDRLDVLAAVEDELGVLISDDRFSEVRTLDDVLRSLTQNTPAARQHGKAA